MRRPRFSWRLPSAHALRENRFLKPFSHHLHHHFLWQFNRRGVAGGVAVGLFFGLLVPFAQIFLAAVAAIVFRVNLPVAAASTLVSNPLTFPGIYYIAYKLGEFLTQRRQPVPESVIESDIQEAIVVQQGDATGWFPHLLIWFESVGLPVTVGLSLLAIVAALAGYFAVSAAWKLRTRLRWHGRAKGRSRDGER
jgi:uncharacterized protein (DUF2062 family)